jgi:hypothetical protein
LVFYRAGVADLRKKKGASKGGFFMTGLCGLLHCLGSLLTRQAFAYHTEDLLCFPLAVGCHLVEDTEDADRLTFLELLADRPERVFPTRCAASWKTCWRRGECIRRQS